MMYRMTSPTGRIASALALIGSWHLPQPSWTRRDALSKTPAHQVAAATRRPILVLRTAPMGAHFSPPRRHRHTLTSRQTARRATTWRPPFPSSSRHRLSQLTIYHRVHRAPRKRLTVHRLCSMRTRPAICRCQVDSRYRSSINAKRRLPRRKSTTRKSLGKGIGRSMRRTICASQWATRSRNTSWRRPSFDPKARTGTGTTNKLPSEVTHLHRFSSKTEPKSVKLGSKLC